MTCDEAEILISARLDEGLDDPPAAVALDAHLAGCAACRATAEAVQVQDAALVRAFAPARRSAEELAERAVTTVFGDSAATMPRGLASNPGAVRLRLWVTGIAASAV